MLIRGVYGQIKTVKHKYWCTYTCAHTYTHPILLHKVKNAQSQLYCYTVLQCIYHHKSSTEACDAAVGFYLRPGLLKIIKTNCIWCTKSYVPCISQLGIGKIMHKTMPTEDSDFSAEMCSS